MTEKEKVSCLAALLIERYGRNAPSVARQRVRLYRRIAKHPGMWGAAAAAADEWSAAAAAARLILADKTTEGTEHHHGHHHQEATLDDLLAGSVTDVRTILKDARKRILKNQSRRRVVRSA